MHWTEEEDKIFRQFYGKISCQEICKQGLLPNRSVSSLYNRANDLGLKNGNRKITHSFNETFWKDPNPINAYWAGEIAADGCIINNRPNRYTFSLQISTKDIEHLEKFRQAIEYSGPIRFYSKRCTLSPMGACSNICYLSLSRAAIWEPDLRLIWGITPRKTYNIIPPVLTDNILKLCYICGYLDGDGTLTADYNRQQPLIRFTSCSATILSWFQKVFDELFPNTSCGPAKSISAPGIEKSNCHYYSISGFRAVKIIEVLSRLPVPKMDRKWKNPRMQPIFERYKTKFSEALAIRLPIEDEIDAFLAKTSNTENRPAPSAPQLSLPKHT